MAENRGYENAPFWDSALSLHKRLDSLLDEMTLDEKLQCLGTGCPEIKRLGIREFYVGGEGAHGLQARHDQSFDKGKPQPTTVLPNPIGMSATWDVELLKEAGRVVGNEARAVYSLEKRGGLCLWAPTVDLERDPRWGRTEEGYGEDPFLAGKMASAYIQGMRGEDPFYIRCGATLKHFYANNVEEGRVWKSSSIDPRNKHEYYLEPFRRAITEGGAEAVMTAYNEVNGVPCLVNDEMKHLLKEQWGLHHVVCDGGDMKQTVDYHRYFSSHAETVAAGLKAGMDCFTDDIGDVAEGTREALEQGMITMEDIDRALRCHFGTLVRLGLFDNVEKNPYRDIGTEELNTRHNQKISYELAKESVVLLKNEPVAMTGKPLLPLCTGCTGETPQGNLLPEGQLAVIGPLADVWYMDWYSGIPPYHVTPLEGITRCMCTSHGMPDRDMGTGELCKEKDIHLPFHSGLPQVKLACGEGYLGLLADGKTVGLVPPEQAEVFEVTLWDKRQVTLRSRSSGLLLATEDGKDLNEIYQDGIVTASRQEAFGWFVREAFHVDWSGESFYAALREGTEFHLQSWSDAEFYVDGKGRLRVPFPEGFVEDGVPQEVQPLKEDGSTVGTEQGHVYRRLPAVHPVLVEDGLQEAAALAKEAGTVIFLAGANPMITCKEEVDRRDIDLPLYQQELLRAVYQVNPRVVLVLVTSVPFGIAWEKEHIPSIVTMASGSMELGNALADVLFGRAAPAGRLNMTWYRDAGQLPDMDDYDIIQGERTYQYFRGEVLYPFGHGLTYSPISYGNLQVRLCDRTVLEVALQITNRGEYRTDEVVQIYVSKNNSVVKRAIRQLKAFTRVKGLMPGETETVSLEIPLADLQYYDVVARQMLLEPGEYEIQAGASSQDIRLRESIVLQGTGRGMRDGMGWNPADHYDSSEHAVLWEGHMGYCCVAGYPGGSDAGNMKLVYGDVFLPQQPSCLVLDAELAAGAWIAASLDDMPAGEYTEGKGCAHDDLVDGTDLADGSKGTVPETGESGYRSGFHEICIPVPALSVDLTPHSSLLPDGEEKKTNPEKKAFRLTLACHGSVKICRWRFI